MWGALYLRRRATGKTVQLGTCLLRLFPPASPLYLSAWHDMVPPGILPNRRHRLLAPEAADRFILHRHFTESSAAGSSPSVHSLAA